MTTTKAADAYILEIIKRLAVERELANEDELSTFVRHEARGARDALQKVLAELPDVLTTIEEQAWEARERERNLRETAYLEALLDDAA